MLNFKKNYVKIKSILVSQPKPESDKSPYFELARKYKIKLDFRPFIQIESVDAKEFRKDRINILDHTAIILTSRNAADNFFRICNEMRVIVPESMKYFCTSESTAYYLQKFVQFRKRKIFNGNQSFRDLAEIIKKHRNENYLLPCSDVHRDEISDFLDQHNIKYSRAVIFKTVASNLQDLKNINYDIIAFFSPSGVKSLFKNFPSFKQNQTKIAAFGLSTAQVVKDSGIKLNIYAPTPEAPSMTMALENFIKNPNQPVVIPVTPPTSTKPVEKTKPLKEVKQVNVSKKTKPTKATKPNKKAKFVKAKKTAKSKSKTKPKKTTKPVKTKKFSNQKETSNRKKKK